MENKINEILATKRAWQKADRRKQNRRKKIGTVKDRNNLAHALYFSRHRERNTPINYCTCSMCESLRERVLPWWRKVINFFV